jgi:alpha/beta superfamily hydrolase
MELLPPLEPFLIPGPAGRIDGRLESPPARGGAHAPPAFLAVFGHPHPRHGGTMQSTVVVHGARALAKLGGAVARFNFRGVGRSEGSYDEGRGELADFLSVVAWLRARWPGARPLLAAGFSFGSLRAFEAAAKGAADAFLGVAPPLELARATPLPRLERPAALVLAQRDELVAIPTDAQLAARFADLRAIEVVPDAGHLFFGRINEVAAAIARAAESLLPPS